MWIRSRSIARERLLPIGGEFATVPFTTSITHRRTVERSTPALL
jgi:hypothetical protein